MRTGIIFGNKILDVVFIAWFIAQFYKVMFSLVVEKKINFRRMWETGGMPSSHSSTVTCLATCIGIMEGLKSNLFAITVIFSGIVMYDAAGIRRAAGKQAGVLNIFLEKIPLIIGKKQYEKYFKDEKTTKLKELLGHTPIEVFVGAIVGIVVGILFRDYLQG